MTNVSTCKRVETTIIHFNVAAAMSLRLTVVPYFTAATLRLAFLLYFIIISLKAAVVCSMCV